MSCNIIITNELSLPNVLLQRYGRRPLQIYVLLVVLLSLLRLNIHGLLLMLLLVLLLVLLGASCRDGIFV